MQGEGSLPKAPGLWKWWDPRGAPSTGCQGDLALKVEKDQQVNLAKCKESGERYEDKGTMYAMAQKQAGAWCTEGTANGHTSIKVGCLKGE